MELIITEKKELPTICLNMIVKNESKIITRLFDSVLKIIDCYCICDTGSTDNTVEVIQNYFSEKNIPGKIVYEPFVNFEYNRNFALKQCVGMSDYVLLIDADMILSIRNFTKSDLIGYDFFTFLQGNESFYYENVRIVKNNGLYNYIGVTHEYVNSPPGSIKKLLNKDIIFINDIGDGGAKNDKSERDIRLLTEAIKELTDKGIKDGIVLRYYFYLANTYRDSGKFELAIETYRKRVELGGWSEEQYHCLYSIGLCYNALKEKEKALFYFMEAHEKNPHRIESLYEIISYYRGLGKFKIALLYYEMAVNILQNNKDTHINKDSFLFLKNDIYTWRLYSELIFIGYYVGIKQINKNIVCTLNFSNDNWNCNNCIFNMKFYRNILNPIKKINLTHTHNFKSIDYNFGSEAEFFSSSSCILPIKNSSCYHFNIRLVDYKIVDNGNYCYVNNKVNTLNKYVTLDSDLNILPFNQKVFHQENYSRIYNGIEDIKIFYDSSEDNIKFIGTGYHQNNKIGIVSGIYNTTGINDTLVPIEIKPSFSNNECEKNWVFFDYNGEMRVVYKWSPIEICKIDYNNGSLNLIERKTDLPGIFKFIRGSTCGFSYKNEIWFIGHIVSYESPRFYYHIMMVFDKQMNLIRYSAPFNFDNINIEFCVGLVVEDERVIVPYSTMDKTTFIGVYGKKYIDENVLVYTPTTSFD